MRQTVVAVAAAAVLVLGVTASSQELIPNRIPNVVGPTMPDQTGFICPMHPDIVSATPGKCPRCGMELIAGNPLMASDFKLTVEATPRVIKPGVPITFHFTATHPVTGEQVRTFELVHDKLYHLFVLSRDMEFFQHVHPEPEQDGTFSLAVTLPKPGHYMLYSDFFPEGGGPQVISTPIVTAGFDGDVRSAIPTLKPDTDFVRRANGVQVALHVEPRQLIAGEELDLPMHFEDIATGAPVTDLERYLGAFGHALVLSEDMVDYIHSHPEEQLEGTNITGGGGPDVIFHALFPRAGRYRIWLQFQRHGTLSTVVFTLKVSKPGETPATP